MGRRDKVRKESKKPKKGAKKHGELRPSTSTLTREVEVVPKGKGGKEEESS